jgi:hypothetical protein
MSARNSPSSNALTKEDYERLDRIITNRMSVGFAWINTAELAEELAEDGHRLIPAMTPGGHTRIVFSDGSEMSLSAFRVIARWLRLYEGQCARPGCTNPLDVTVEADNRERGARLDREFCSNACRQRAYRRRKREEAA